MNYCTHLTQKGQLCQNLKTKDLLFGGNPNWCHLHNKYEQSGGVLGFGFCDCLAHAVDEHGKNRYDRFHRPIYKKCNTFTRNYEEHDGKKIWKCVDNQHNNSCQPWKEFLKEHKSINKIF